MGVATAGPIPGQNQDNHQGRVVPHDCQVKLREMCLSTWPELPKEVGYEWSWHCCSRSIRVRIRRTS